MKIIVIGATGTIGAAVASALAARKHEVVRASRQGDVKVDLEEQATIGALFAAVRNADAVISCAGSAVFKPFAELSDADYALGLRSKLMGQVALARFRQGSPQRGRLDHAHHRHPGDASDARLGVDLARQCRPRRLRARRRARIAAQAAHRRTP